jgi:hypothetical protein
MGATNRQCMLCGERLESIEADPVHSTLLGNCKRCGRYSMAEEAIYHINKTPQAQRYLLSAYCRRFPQHAGPALITPDSIPQIIRDMPRYTPPEMLDNILSLIARMSPGPSDFSTFDVNTDYPTFIARSVQEAKFYLDELVRRQFIAGGTQFVVTFKGWEHLEEIKRRGQLSNRVFVAMWFDKRMDDLFEKGIDPAIRKAKYVPLRIDRHEHVNRIDDEIIGQIKRSRFMVADFTGNRHGVYFEAGLMMGLGRTVVWMCNADELKEMHFDVRQFNFIDYESLENAKTRLYNRILAIEGEGPGELE